MSVRLSFERVEPLYGGTTAYHVWQGARFLGRVEGFPSSGRAAGAYWRAWRASNIAVMCRACGQPDRFPTRVKAVERLRR